ncbi:hypothetical protein RJ640_006302 [Escallonia rubra]|uniref:Receptor-like serine/threonine-protein kinase n=1 Tax=Escallonia rubra TaxID=112253 RepID=A0AA88R9J5_9ASTE|nr:hypothetical protein RJ640_006302 [Escallonia rubra]
MEGLAIWVLLSSSFSILLVSYGGDTLTPYQNLTDGKTLVSSDGTFELGFFTPGDSKNRFLGIWYKKITSLTVVWVAHRDVPLANTSGVLKLTQQGILTLQNDTNGFIWSSNSSRSIANPVAQLLNTGNFVIGGANDSNAENYLWQSFDYPTDTLLPGMKHGINFVTGIDRQVSPWKTTSDPSRGDTIFRMDPRGFPQQLLLTNSIELFRSGPWNGLRFSGSPGLKPNPLYTYEFVFNKEEVYYMFELINSSVYSRLTLNTNGVLQRLTWNYRTQEWVVYLNVPADNCDHYLLCHAYGSCIIGNSPVCGCLDKFVPKSQKDWDRADWSSGCVRKTPLDCQKGDGFLKYTGVKLPDTRNSWFNWSMTLDECHKVCLNNCTCMAYANLDIRARGSGCLLWFGNLVDIRQLLENGQDIYIRMASSELSPSFPVFLSSASWTSFRLKMGQPVVMYYILNHYVVQYYKRSTVYAQQNCFPSKLIIHSSIHCTRQGMLEDGQEVAVKRLSMYSSQGVDEFKNEVICIAKLQHRNLVRLLGCCIEGEEKMLIYEYMPNNSLDTFIFDQTRNSLLDWPTRFRIINGIARGLLYLHQDSRLRIIHRDLKAANVLLDIDMNPKISDFGMARSFGGNETQANTQRVVGTYGYMSPEYAVDGHFSVKSDVFSFGVLVLEIVSDKRNRGFFHQDHHHNLLGHAWILFNKGRSLELIDARMGDSCYLSEVLRSIHVALLCVQQSPEDRPSMSSVVLMLGGEGTLPQPKEPGFFTKRNLFFEADTSSSNNAAMSVNDISITQLDAR